MSTPSDQSEPVLDLTDWAKSIAARAKRSPADAARGLAAMEAVVPGITAWLRRNLEADLAREEDDTDG